MSYQQVYLRELQRFNSNAMVNLMQRGFGGSLSCDLFSCLHGVLITEIFNGQTKRQSSPHCAGFSTDIAKVNTWLLHLISMKNSGKLIRKKIQLNTSTDHKECTAGARRLRNNNADFLKEKLLSSYQADPFGAGKTRDIATGKKITGKSH